MLPPSSQYSEYDEQPGSVWFNSFLSGGGPFFVFTRWHPHTNRLPLPRNNNAYEVNSVSPLALQYGDSSVLERHHVFVTYQVHTQTLMIRV